MAILSQLSELDLFLLTVENDEEDSPWMVMADLQVRGVDLLKPILLLHAERNHLPWYIASYLLITTPRPEGERTLEAARAEAEAARAEAEAARAAEEAARAQVAENEVERLREELRRLRGGQA